MNTPLLLGYQYTQTILPEELANNKKYKNKIPSMGYLMSGIYINSDTKTYIFYMDLRRLRFWKKVVTLIFFSFYAHNACYISIKVYYTDVWI